MTAHIPIMLLVIIMVGAVLTMSVGAVAKRSLRDGMMYWTAGLAMHTASYVLFSQRDTMGEFPALVLANLLRACAWAVFAEGLCQFYRRPPPRALIWAPVAMVVLTFVFLLEHLALRLIAVNVIFAAQGLLAFSFMWQERRVTPGRGKYFAMAGLVLAITLLAMRAAGATRGATHALVSLTESSPIQTVSFLGAMIVLLLLSVGFVIMSKDRSDDMNRILAARDELTGLANRRRMNEVLGSEWARAKRSDQSLALAMIDIDQFKRYNDHYGHQAGDHCLKQVAQAIQSCAGRAGDLAARYGGEEFLLILPDTDAAAAQSLAEAVRKAIESLALPHVHSPTGKVTTSVGVAALTDGLYKDAAGLLRAADEALYRAKNGGRNQVQVALESLRPGPLAGSAPEQLVELIWRRSYESGNPVIDAQHRTLFRDANKLLSAVLGGRQKDEVMKLVEVFIADIAQHFQEEEAIITKARCPGAADHAGLHHVLLQQALALAERFRDGALSPGELFEYLAHQVVARHILIEDRALFAAFESSTVDASAGTAPLRERMRPVATAKAGLLRLGELGAPRVSASPRSA